MFKVFVLAFTLVNGAPNPDPIWGGSSKQTYATKEACEAAWNDPSGPNSSAFLTLALTAQAGQEVSLTHECKEPGAAA